MKFIPESLEESMDFERGLDPKKAMDIGVNRPLRPGDKVVLLSSFTGEPFDTAYYIRTQEDGGIVVTHPHQGEAVYDPDYVVRESVNFERGIDPKRSTSIGLEAPRRFKNIQEFTDFIIAALPLIFGGKIPEDILSKHENGMLPESYYGKIAYWLSERGFEMSDGNSDWESEISRVPEEFAYWTTPIVKRLEQILGQKRWSEYDED